MEDTSELQKSSIVSASVGALNVPVGAEYGTDTSWLQNRVHQLQWGL